MAIVSNPRLQPDDPQQQCWYYLDEKIAHIIFMRLDAETPGGNEGEEYFAWCGREEFSWGGENRKKIGTLEDAFNNDCVLCETCKSAYERAE